MVLSGLGSPFVTVPISAGSALNGVASDARFFSLPSTVRKYAYSKKHRRLRFGLLGIAVTIGLAVVLSTVNDNQSEQDPLAPEVRSTPSEDYWSATTVMVPLNIKACGSVVTDSDAFRPMATVCASFDVEPVGLSSSDDVEQGQPPEAHLASRNSIGDGDHHIGEGLEGVLGDDFSCPVPPSDPPSEVTDSATSFQTSENHKEGNSSPLLLYIPSGVAGFFSVHMEKFVLGILAFISAFSSYVAIKILSKCRRLVTRRKPKDKSVVTEVEGSAPSSIASNLIWIEHGASGQLCPISFMDLATMINTKNTQGVASILKDIPPTSANGITKELLSSASLPPVHSSSKVSEIQNLPHVTSPLTPGSVSSQAQKRSSVTYHFKHVQIRIYVAMVTFLTRVIKHLNSKVAAWSGPLFLAQMPQGNTASAGPDLDLGAEIGWEADEVRPIDKGKGRKVNKADDLVQDSGSNPVADFGHNAGVDTSVSMPGDGIRLASGSGEATNDIHSSPSLPNVLNPDAAPFDPRGAAGGSVVSTTAASTSAALNPAAAPFTPAIAAAPPASDPERKPSRRERRIRFRGPTLEAHRSLMASIAAAKAAQVARA